MAVAPTVNVFGSRVSCSPSSFNGSVMRQQQQPRRVAMVSRAGNNTSCKTINPDLRKTEKTAIDAVNVSEISKPLTAYCRCWRSATFPLCDGAHVKYNKETSDNVGPLLLKKKE